MAGFCHGEFFHYFMQQYVMIELAGDADFYIKWQMLHDIIFVW